MLFKKYISLTIVFFLAVACTTNPFSGKKTWALVPNSQILPMAFQQYDKFLAENKVVKGTSDAEMIQRVGRNISTAAERYLNANGYAGYLKDYKWEYNLVENKAVNAWCMPGGKIVFYTGILPIAGGERGIAAIMGHEVVHALANHGQQRMSAGQLQAIGAVAGNAAFAKNPKNQQIFNQAYGVGTQVGIMLPFSRSHETESDKVGLFLMAIAGYDPAEAPELWRRMKANSGGQAPPEILSTHPSNNTRIANLESWVEAAKAEARKYGVTKFR
ncbi:MAG: M48 family metallopeptidase [Flavobacteriaceae bacterium]|nr:M48 family metallopeptidase [Flavobacteriaceae bacterium]